MLAMSIDETILNGLGQREEELSVIVELMDVAKISQTNIIQEVYWILKLPLKCYLRIPNGDYNSQPCK